MSLNLPCTFKIIHTANIEIIETTVGKKIPTCRDIRFHPIYRIFIQPLVLQKSLTG